MKGINKENKILDKLITKALNNVNAGISPKNAIRLAVGELEECEKQIAEKAMNKFVKEGIIWD